MYSNSKRVDCFDGGPLPLNDKGRGSLLPYSFGGMHYWCDMFAFFLNLCSNSSIASSTLTNFLPCYIILTHTTGWEFVSTYILHVDCNNPLIWILLHPSIIQIFRLTYLSSVRSCLLSSSPELLGRHLRWYRPNHVHKACYKRNSAALVMILVLL